MALSPENDDPEREQLPPADVWVMLDELNHRWRKFRYARTRMENARAEAEDVIRVLYPHVSGGVLADITGLTRARIWQIYHESRAEKQHADH